jgi:xanthine permease XanP
LRDLGARRDVATRVEFAVQQVIEAVIEFAGVEGPISCEISYDEFDIDVALAYTGTPLDLSGPRPTFDEIMASERGATRLSCFLLRQQSDKAQALFEDRAAKLFLHFRY